MPKWNFATATTIASTAAAAKVIERGKLDHVFVGLHGDPAKPANKQIIRRARQLATGRKNERRSLSVSFFDSGSAKVWSP